MTVAASSDFCLTYLLHDGAFRGRLVRLDQTLAEILHRHAYPAPVGKLLAETAVLAVVLAFSMKFDGVFTLQAQGDGPIRLLVADVTSSGEIRAYAGFDASAFAPGGSCAASASTKGGSCADGELSLPRLLGNGQLIFTVDLGNSVLAGSPQRYQGVVPLEDATLSDCIHRYFRQSEQLETAVKVSVTAHDGAFTAGAVMVQRMPTTPADHRSEEELEDLWRTVVALLGSLTDGELLDHDLSAETILFRLFHQENLGVAAEQRPLRFGCRCSREKVEIALKGFAATDREEMKQDDGSISAQCQFCSTDYRFTAEEVAALLSQDAG